MRASKHSRGFTLVEIVLALGLFSFCFMAILGLISTGLNNSKNSLDETALATASRQVISALRSGTFGGIPNLASVSFPQSSTDAMPTPVAIETVYFDINGKRLQDTNGTDLDRAAALQNNAVYQCVVMAAGDAELLGAAVSESNTKNLISVELIFTWPIQTGTASNSMTFQTNIAKYN
jgi:uncharacterized protein (TIGR02598 family)